MSDLIFQVKIEAAAGRMGFPIGWIPSPADLKAAHPVAAAQTYADWGEDLASWLIDRVSDWLPALILFDLGNEAIPALPWIRLLKSTPATRRIPVIGYGSHVAGELLQSAKRAGAEAILARSAFAADPGGLIAKYQRIPEHAQPELMEAFCQAALSQPARRGLELFNQGRYFEAHELLEAAWMESSAPGKELYRAVLQIAVAYYQIERQNYPGAVKMFWRSRQWLNPLPDECQGINVARLRQDARSVYLAVAGSDPGEVVAFDPRLLKPVEYR